MMQLKKKHSEVVYNKNKFPLAFNCNTDACLHTQNRMDAVRRKPTFTIFTAFCCTLQMIVNTLPTYSPTGFVTFRNYSVKCIVIATGIENWPGQKNGTKNKMEINKYQKFNLGQKWNQDMQRTWESKLHQAQAYMLKASCLVITYFYVTVLTKKLMTLLTNWKFKTAENLEIKWISHQKEEENGTNWSQRTEEEYGNRFRNTETKCCRSGMLRNQPLALDARDPSPACKWRCHPAPCLERALPSLLPARHKSAHVAKDFTNLVYAYNNLSANWHSSTVTQRKRCQNTNQGL